MKTTYVPGKWLAICDVCGFKFYNTELQKNWQGLMVCHKDYESRHMQDLIKVSANEKPIPWVRPEEVPVYLETYACTLEGIQGIAGIGVAGCMRAAFISPY